jgi:hypothetical protein
METEAVPKMLYNYYTDSGQCPKQITLIASNLCCVMRVLCKSNKWKIGRWRQSLNFIKLKDADICRTLESSCWCLLFEGTIPEFVNTWQQSQKKPGSSWTASHSKSLQQPLYSWPKRLLLSYLWTSSRRRLPCIHWWSKRPRSETAPPHGWKAVQQGLQPGPQARGSEGGHQTTSEAARSD